MLKPPNWLIDWMLAIAAGLVIILSLAFLVLEALK